jgi:hypothetical protein
MSDRPTLVTADELATTLKISTHTVRRLTKTGHLATVGTYIKPSGHIVPLYRAEDIGHITAGQSIENLRTRA